ncbi:galactose-specific lectin nattectin-like [Centroberyx affinis]|uniref:galactose-specific lectin nattectin-like n=1 Tax=Centroberyx affinis TaxID=166261 RepID=UPI003A5C05E3
MRCVGGAAVLLLVLLVVRDSTAWYDAAREDLMDFCYTRHRLVRCGAAAGKGSWYKTDGNRCIALYMRPTTFDSALAGCRSVGGDLVSIHSERDYNNVLCYLVRASGRPVRAWVGGQRQPNGRFAWSDGSNMDFTRWKSGQPDFYRQNEKCMEMYAGRFGEWNDENCSVKKAFVCAKKV